MIRSKQLLKEEWKNPILFTAGQSKPPEGGAELGEQLSAVHISNAKRGIQLPLLAVWLSLGLSYTSKSSRWELSTWFLLRTLEFNSIVCVHKNCFCIFFIVSFCLSLKQHGAKLNPTSEFPNIMGLKNLWLLTSHLHILDYCKLSYYSWQAQLNLCI